MTRFLSENSLATYEDYDIEGLTKYAQEQTDYEQTEYKPAEDTYDEFTEQLYIAYSL